MKYLYLDFNNSNKCKIVSDFELSHSIKNAIENGSGELYELDKLIDYLSDKEIK